MAEEKKQNDISRLSFEKAIKSLGEIVDKVESGQAPLEASIEQYEQGMALIKHCRKILQAAERKIERIAAEKTGDSGQGSE